MKIQSSIPNVKKLLANRPTAVALMLVLAAACGVGMSAVASAASKAPVYHRPHGAVRKCFDGGTGYCVNLLHAKNKDGQPIDLQGHPFIDSCENCENSNFFRYKKQGIVSNFPNLFSGNQQKFNKEYHGSEVDFIQYEGKNWDPRHLRCVGVQPKHVYFAVLEDCSSFTRVVNIVVGGSLAYVDVRATNLHNDGHLYVLTGAASKDGAALKYIRLKVQFTGLGKESAPNQNLENCGGNNCVY